MCGLLDGKEICLLGIYAPNTDDHEFFHNIKQELIPYIGTPLILAGDLNCIVDGDLTGTLPKPNTKPYMTTALGDVMTQLTCRDVWRDKHPAQKEYTCFTPGHRSQVVLTESWFLMILPPELLTLYIRVDIGRIIRHAHYTSARGAIDREYLCGGSDQKHSLSGNLGKI